MLEVEKYSSSIVDESFRKIKTNIECSYGDKNYKVIAITSSKYGEGKTFVAANLALILSQGNKRVMLVDCDFRNPNIHKKFNISNVTGLSEILMNGDNLNIATREYNENFFVMTAGKMPSNPSETLASNKMSDLLEKLKKDYDYIILDTSPILFFSDSQVVSNKADGTILVVRSDKTKNYEVREAYNILKNINVNMIGVILNGIRSESKKYFKKHIKK
ncbi:CpsD/CapB family tyrosine-protein kinase [Clostridium sp.]|uniref:CpsD/CapB family tyrosine-protein kinase n=1 Tax=Clostridium sp. TaxID=1506 RepID=UPI00290FB85B|nr:CpsD/CapB family tyrosine-protein kinase [Clostridium sp.]MDU5107834.1 CpsD/CapB family tyrosine-protein kinase [Clostridium sp.]